MGEIGVPDQLLSSPRWSEFDDLCIHCPKAVYDIELGRVKSSQFLGIQADVGGVPLLD